MRTKRQRLIKALDKVFSEYIRRKEQGICFTCGIKKPWREMQAGHYLSRSVKQFRWDERNVHCQDVGCNVFKHGDLITYRQKMVEKYGKEFVELIEAERHKFCHISTGELEVLINHYKSEVKKLEHSGLESRRNDDPRRHRESSL